MYFRTRCLPSALPAIALLSCSLSLHAATEEHKESKPAKPPAAAAAAAQDAPKTDAHAPAVPAAAKIEPPVRLKSALTKAEPIGGPKIEAAARAEPAVPPKAVAMIAPPAHRAVEHTPPPRPMHRAPERSPERPVAVKPPPPRVTEAIATAEAEKSAGHHKPHWSYEGATGPQAWAKLSPEFAACKSGTRQSPIDIRDGMKVDLDPVTFDYRPNNFRVIDNGHTIQANVSGWNSLRHMGRRYRLVQFHFHTPSEESIDGKQFDMVVHLVHQDGEGRLAVVAVLVESGARQPAIQAVLNNLPLERGEEYPASTQIDLNQLLPSDRRYFTYMGSLTTPPCTEDVLWIVMKQPVQATRDQLNLFARLYPMNARPTQDARDRIIKESN